VKELKDEEGHISFGHEDLWNPVKELKVLLLLALPHPLDQWNPVKELKDELRRSGWRAERGLWNPVKELKV